jgi:HAD superfamily hydrolase (TIGR01509 family)
MKKFRSIIFDCDGVLIDSEIIAGRIEMEVKTELGFPITLEEQLKTFVGLGMSHPIVQQELKRLPPHFLQTVDERVKIAYLTELKAIANVSDVLKKITLPKCVASSSEHEWLDFKLKHTKLDHHFPNAIFNGGMVKKSKPAPDLFLLALDRMGWSAENTLVIEDSVAGVQAGKAACLTVWGFTGGAHIYPGHAEKLVHAGANRIFSDFRDVLKLIDSY